MNSREFSELYKASWNTSIFPLCFHSLVRSRVGWNVSNRYGFNHFIHGQKWNRPEKVPARFYPRCAEKAGWLVRMPPLYKAGAKQKQICPTCKRGTYESLSCLIAFRLLSCPWWRQSQAGPRLPHRAEAEMLLRKGASNSQGVNVPNAFRSSSQSPERPRCRAK